MKKLIVMTAIVVFAGVVVTASARAQQGPAASAPKSSATTTPAKSPAPSGMQSSQAANPDGGELKTDKDKASYAIGMNIGQNLKKESAEIDAALVERGMKDALAGKPPLLTEEEEKAALMTLQATMRKKQTEQMQQLAETNKKDGEAFLAANKTKDGVVTLPSGLQYKILTAGTGPKPTASDTVTANYRGTLMNGTEFDASSKHGGAQTFPVTGVIKGWTEALQQMPVGSKWELFIPSELAYGPNGKGPIEPNSMLIFEVELVSIQEKSADQAPSLTPGANAAGGAGAAPAAAPTKDPGKDK
jgi:FKBP-type peptidyl-prolyl cis-trans isomerase